MDGRILTLIPIYMEELSGNEKRSLDEVCEKLKNVPLEFMAPGNLNCEWYRNTYPNIPIKSFDCWDKQSLQDYNDLLMTPEFYRTFEEYEYIFIFQTDARFLGTENQLIAFADKGFDYIGAPWGQNGMRFLKRVIPGAGHSKLLRKLEGEVIARVGNGGVSLRRVSAMIRFLESHKKELSEWEKAEDLFIGYYGAKHPKSIALADVETAYSFAMEMDMEEYIKAGRIPMAVHKWEKFFPTLNQYL